MSTSGKMPEDAGPPYIQRLAYEAKDNTDVFHAACGAEMPDLTGLEQRLMQVVNAAKAPLKDKLLDLYHLRKDTYNVAQFDQKLKEILASITAEELAIVNQLCQNHGINDIHIFYPTNITEKNNFAYQIMHIYIAHLRQIAKKGTTLDGLKVVQSTQFRSKDPLRARSLHFTIDTVDKGESEIQYRLDITKRVVDSIMTPAYVDALFQQAVAKWDPTKGNEISVIRLVRDFDKANTNYNMLTNMSAQMLLNELNERAKNKDLRISFVDQPVMTLTMTSRTESTAYERLPKQPLFDATPLANKNILVNDDHVNAGAFTAGLFAMSKALNSNVVGVSSLTVHPHSTTLAPDPRVLQEIRTICDTESVSAYQALVDALAVIGLSMPALTSREGLTILAIIMDGKNPEHVKRFKELNQDLSKTQTVEGKSDSLLEVLMDPKEHLTASALAERLTSDAVSMKYRKLQV